MKFFWFFYLCLFLSTYAQVDNNATKETRNLFNYLKKVSKKHILFGHQHATEYGHGWSNEPNKSDVKSVVGTHPAVIGVDFSSITTLNDEFNSKNLTNLRNNIVDTYQRGGITTVAWHFSNPAGPGGFYYKDSTTVKATALLKPGGSHHQTYKQILKNIAKLANSVKTKEGTLAPMIFRPFHEMDGDWFWWGKSHCTKEDFKEVWRFTFNYLKDSLQVHNFLYAYSPDNKFLTENEYLDRYPGNEFVDLVGMDNYGDFGRTGVYNLEEGLKKLKIVSDFAQKNNKLAAFTETGLESITNTNWWTEILLKTLKQKDLKLFYVLVWRNDIKSPTHYYAPFPGHKSVPDFIKFYNDRFTIFEGDLRRVYKNKLF